MNKGFTLIELLVVVLIIGILAAVALPQYTKAVEKSRTAEVVTLMGDIMTGERIYQLATGQYTMDLSALDIEVPNLSGTHPTSFVTKNYTVKMAGGGANTIVASAERNAGATGSYTLRMALWPNGVIKRACEASGTNNVCASMADWGDTVVVPS